MRIFYQTLVVAAAAALLSAGAASAASLKITGGETLLTIDAGLDELGLSVSAYAASENRGTDIALLATKIRGEDKPLKIVNGFSGILITDGENELRLRGLRLWLDRGAVRGRYAGYEKGRIRRVFIIEEVAENEVLLKLTKRLSNRMDRLFGTETEMGDQFAFASIALDVEESGEEVTAMPVPASGLLLLAGLGALAVGRRKARA